MYLTLFAQTCPSEYLTSFIMVTKFGKEDPLEARKSPMIWMYQVRFSWVCSWALMVNATLLKPPSMNNFSGLRDYIGLNPTVLKLCLYAILYQSSRCISCKIKCLIFWMFLILMSHVMRRNLLCHMQTTKVLNSHSVWSVWSVPLLFAA